jgi:DNA topoisomerase-2
MVAGPLTFPQKHWLGVYHADYRKLKNQARFIQEIIDNDLIVGKKKKVILVQELRDRKYEGFPPNKNAEKKNTEDELDASENDEDETVDGDARDYDYLLSVRSCASHCKEDKTQ